jgi:thiol:disulfide interchange protein
MGQEIKAFPDCGRLNPGVLEVLAAVKFKLLVLAAGAVAVLLVAAGTARSASREIYPDAAQGKGDLAAGLKAAAQSHKRVIVDFGGNWCGDCQVLDIYFHNPQNRPILESNYVLVHINIGRMDENLDIAERYGIPVTLGVPALAVLAENGKVLYGQRGGEFSHMGRMESSAVTKFLVQWRPPKAGCSVMVVNC